MLPSSISLKVLTLKLTSLLSHCILLQVFNTGDPFTENNSVINSKFMERAVLDYYAELWNAKWPHDENDGESYWGYITPMGASEANIYALWNARDYLSGKLSAAEAGIFKHVAENSNAYNPVLLSSGSKHYSFPKGCAILGLGTVIEIPVDATGAVRIEDLTKAAEFYASQGHPIIICFNYGSTVNGAYDDVARACEALKPILEKYNLFERDLVYENEAGEIKKSIRRAGYWVHVDGAFGSSYMPFIEMAHSRGMIGAKGPTFDFRLPMVSSISSSEQKFTGVPVPTGILMSKVKFQIIADSPPEYIGGRPTLSGTRNGLAPMLLWNSIARNSYDDKIKKALAIQETAEYMEKKLRNLQDIDVKRNPLSLTLRFKCPNNDICKKYSLWADNVNGSFYTNVFAMEHVSKELIDALFEDLSAPDAFKR
ncbi:hypothetical protein KP509_17G003300 [Ceratopteris richardii]|uniref:Histidine decarboxylase n=1 Tax=Ceratopteris richardii TaxID=49495 RepID=A0A8T2SRR2_CERRI|nr:hypothetical protein KP509_17G003300 [Ceratopteris richardii]